MKLTQSQQLVFDQISGLWDDNAILSVKTGRGFGKSTILTALHEKYGGVLVGTSEFLKKLQTSDPYAFEEAFAGFVTELWAEHEVIFLDDLHLIHSVTTGSCYFNAYPRPNLFELVLNSLVKQASRLNRRLVFARTGESPEQLKYATRGRGFDYFDTTDYSQLLATVLPSEAAEALDIEKIHRFAPRLNGYQLKGACRDLSSGPVTTTTFIDYLRAAGMQSNVDLNEVQQVDLTVLKGMDDVLETLEANIVLPLENDELSTEYQLSPKRGVLLAGPPGTGKTTIGRALAWRLKSKFFLIDGTVIAGDSNFYGRVDRIFEAAEENAPAIIFIDDGDVIFEDEDSAGFYRYLLTMLDGLESESRGQVCVMMTAMNVGSLPPALLRSGRIELWLETRLPDADARRGILTEFIGKLPDQLQELDIDRLVGASEGLTGADLKRMMEDGKLLVAFDVSRNKELRPLTEYFQDAIQTVLQNRERYLAAKAAVRAADSS